MVVVVVMCYRRYDGSSHHSRARCLSGCLVGILYLDPVTHALVVQQTRRPGKGFLVLLSLWASYVKIQDFGISSSKLNHGSTTTARGCCAIAQGLCRTDGRRRGKSLVGRTLQNAPVDSSWRVGCMATIGIVKRNDGALLYHSSSC